MQQFCFNKQTVLLSISTLVILLILCFPAFADNGQTSLDINWLNLCMGLFGGLALFLAGLDMLSEGLKKAAGDTLKVLLSKMTNEIQNITSEKRQTDNWQ